MRKVKIKSTSYNSIPLYQHKASKSIVYNGSGNFYKTISIRQAL